MTSATSRSKSRGFSLIELLVVIGIILILAGIALPMLIKAYSYASKSKARADLNTIAVALSAYKADFGDYPRPVNDTTTYRGARALCQALVAPGTAAQDGADGLGFRERAGMGPVRGPYLQMDRFKLAQPDSAGNPAAWVLTDKDGNAILYYVASSRPLDVSSTGAGTITSNSSPSDTVGRYSYADNSTYLSAGQPQFQAMLGDIGTVNNKADSGENIVNQPYLLWSPGADGTYGPTAPTKAAVQACDDVTNIQQ
jgi:prepilin-type N-terminal cleavage/methylation domain-containing protein